MTVSFSDVYLHGYVNRVLTPSAVCGVHYVRRLGWVWPFCCTCVCICTSTIWHWWTLYLSCPNRYEEQKSWRVKPSQWPRMQRRKQGKQQNWRSRYVLCQLSWKGRRRGDFIQLTHCSLVVPLPRLNCCVWWEGVHICYRFCLILYPTEIATPSNSSLCSYTLYALRTAPFICT